MTTLQYVGFNGYHTCPIDTNFSQIISNWMCINSDNLLNISCTHRVLIIESQNVLNIYGTINCESTYHFSIKKPVDFSTIVANEEYIIGCHKAKIYKFRFKSFDWKETNLIFVNEKDERIWNEENSEVVKCVFVLNELILLTNNGNVWKMAGERLAIVHVNDVEKAVDICAGFEHCLILTESGCVLSFGGGSRGQLGHGDLNSTCEPVQISALEGLKVTKISAGGWHSCAITDSGDLCVWGWNNYGQLSSINQQEDCGLLTLPEFVDVGPDTDSKVVDVGCGSRHTIARLENGDVYATGWNLYHQLGVEVCDEKITKFTKCAYSLQKGNIVCGPWYTILVTDYGK